VVLNLKIITLLTWPELI